MPPPPGSYRGGPQRILWVGTTASISVVMSSAGFIVSVTIIVGYNPLGYVSGVSSSIQTPVGSSGCTARVCSMWIMASYWSAGRT